MPEEWNPKAVPGEGQQGDRQVNGRPEMAPTPEEGNTMWSMTLSLVGGVYLGMLRALRPVKEGRRWNGLA